MLDHPGDIDRNGIPDAVQRDPVVVPEPIVRFGDPAEPGLPGITAPIEATADAPAEPMPEPPIAPTPPPEDADEATRADYMRAHMEYQQAVARYQLIVETLTNISKMRAETLKGIADHLR